MNSAQVSRTWAEFAVGGPADTKVSEVQDG
jgi:hypothetical protein